MSANPWNAGKFKVTHFGQIGQLTKGKGAAPPHFERLIQKTKASASDRKLLFASYRLLTMTIRNRDAHAYVPPRSSSVSANVGMGGSRVERSTAPVFETTFEKRRLRVLNSLLRALDRLNVSVSIDGREARTLVAHVADFSVSFTIDGTFSKATSHATQQRTVGG